MDLTDPAHDRFWPYTITLWNLTATKDLLQESHINTAQAYCSTSVHIPILRIGGCFAETVWTFKWWMHITYVIAVLLAWLTLQAAIELFFLLMLHFSSTNTHTTSSEELLSIHSPPSLYSFLGLSYLKSRTLTSLHFMRLARSQLLSLSRSLWRAMFTPTRWLHHSVLSHPHTCWDALNPTFHVTSKDVKHYQLQYTPLRVNTHHCSPPGHQTIDCNYLN